METHLTRAWRIRFFEVQITNFSIWGPLIWAYKLVFQIWHYFDLKRRSYCDLRAKTQINWEKDEIIEKENRGLLGDQVGAIFGQQSMRESC